MLTTMASLPAHHPSRAPLRDQAIEAWLPLARHLAHRYSGRGEPTDDLIQTATVGLIKAVDKFDPDRGVDFAGYAIPTIIGEIKRHFRDRTWSVRVPRRLQELRLAITEANSTLTHTLGRSPTVADIAAHLGVTEEEVLEGLEGARAYNATTLSTPISARRQHRTRRHPRRRGPRIRTRRAPRRPRPRPGHPRRTRTEDPHPALLRQPDPVADRRPDRHLPDARLPPAHPGPHQAARPTAATRRSRAGDPERARRFSGPAPSRVRATTGWTADTVGRKTHHRRLQEICMAQRVDDGLIITLKRVAAVLKQAEVPFALGGSFAVYAHGGHSSDHDVDFLIREAGRRTAAGGARRGGLHRRAAARGLAGQGVRRGPAGGPDLPAGRDARSPTRRSPTRWCGRSTRSTCRCCRRPS